jgi:outer membrane protein TolC
MACMIDVSFVSAQELFTWEECVREALNNNPDLVSAREKVNQAKADKRVTRSAILPQISSQLNGKKSKTATKEAAETYSYSITGEQLLFDGFKTIADIKSDSKIITAQEYDYLVTSSDIRLNLRVAFVTLLRAQELVVLTKEISERRKQNLELVQLRYEGGREHKGALLTAQADLAEAEFEVAQAERNLFLSQQELIKEIGWGKRFPIKVKGAFVIHTIAFQKPDIESLAETNPFLKELIAKKEAARFDYNSAQADFFPQIYLSSSFDKTHSNWPPQDEGWSAGVRVSFPIFEGGSRLAKTSKAKSQLRQAQADERSGRDGVILTLEETWKSFQDAGDTVLVKKKFLEAAQERAKIANTQYSQGLITFNDWVIIEDNLVNATKTYLNAQADSLIAEANWIQAKGGILEYVQD